MVQRSRDGKVSAAPWAVHDGIFESGPGGSISTRDSFGDAQLHIEFATPVKVAGASQGRGNSGVIFMGRYEIQILDSYEPMPTAWRHRSMVNGRRRSTPRACPANGRRTTLGFRSAEVR